MRLRKACLLLPLCIAYLSAVSPVAAALLPSSIEVGDGMVVRTVLVQHTGEWFIENNVSWIATAMAGGYGDMNLEVAVDRNTSGTDRQASITISGETLTITQHGAGSGLHELWTVGDDAAGQLGDSRILFRSSPVPVWPGTISAAAGSNFSLLLKQDGTLWSVGDNIYGQLGDGTALTRRDVPVQIAADVISVTAGIEHALFIKADGTLWATGNGEQGQLGAGVTVIQSIAPVQVATDVAKVAAGGYHTLILKTDGTLWATGWNIYGELGPTVYEGTSTPVQVATDVTDIAAGDFHSLFLKNDGSLWAMGDDGHGQLGDEAFGTMQPPVEMATDVASIAAGANHSLFVKTDGSLWATGDNSSGQLGDGTTTQRDTPVLIATGVSSVTAGGQYSLFVKTDGTLWAMGDNSQGQLGDGTTASSTTPVMVNTSIEWVSSGANHSFIRKIDGSFWAFGSNLDAQLGDQTVSQRIAAVEVGTDVAAVASEYSHTLIVRTDGTLWAMGDNTYGQLGDGSAGTDESTPVQVASGVAKTNGSIATGRYFSLFVKTDGTLWGMGDNGAGELGVAGPDYKDTPVQIVTGVSSVAAGWEHSLFVKTDGTLWAMGQNDWGQLGDGTSTLQPSPVLVATGVVAAAAGEHHSAFIKTDGTLWAMGQNSAGQLGDGTNTRRPSPVQIATDVSAVSAGRRHTLFVKADGSLWVTGSNNYGQLGDGTSMTALNTPLQVATGVASVAGGMNHSVFLKTDGSLWAMGDNSWGQLGDGTTIERDSPVMVATGVTTASAGRAHSVFIATGPTGDPPKISVYPSNRTIETGQDVTLGVAASGVGSLQFQWLKNGAAIPGATTPTLAISNAQSSDSGVYSVVVTNVFGSVTSVASTLTVSASPPPSVGPRLINVSARALAGSGDTTLIAGFYISGSSSKTVLIRGIGPRLADYDVPNVVTDPSIRLYHGNTPIIENDDWDPALAPDFSAVGAFDLIPGSKDAALKVTLKPGIYSVHLLNPGAIAEGLIEVYDLSRDPDSWLSNVSCRLKINSGQTVIVGTAVIGGDIPILARNVGPELANYGLAPEAVLPDPQLRVFTGQTEVAFNDNWESATAAYFGPVGAFPLTDGSKDSALHVVFGPGGHTAHATGVGSGVALIELYESN